MDSALPRGLSSCYPSVTRSPMRFPSTLAALVAPLVLSAAFNLRATPVFAGTPARPAPTPRPDTEGLELRLAGGTFRPAGSGAGTTVPSPPAWYRAAAIAALPTSPRGRRYLVAVT